MPPITPNKRFLRAVQENKVFVMIYNHATRGQTWFSSPYGMWFYTEHLNEGWVEPISITNPDLFCKSGVLVKLTQKAIDWLDAKQAALAQRQSVQPVTGG